MISSVDNFIFINVFAVKVDGSDVNFNSKNVYEYEILSQQDISQFFSGESKEYKYSKFPQTLYAL